ncbi:undecaprenyldiphospho-muramoylpentapeptide beta-N-acetylglucosaminyltransferase [bacterium]|nr:undecaprenyldiphospho-muramoylpentapeptide beta-N-acetylglucosaminyltransferase [bacterium]
MFDKNKEKIYFITGGGTGGHIYPALAVAEGLVKQGVELQNIYYLGNHKNLEHDIVTKSGYQFLSYSAKGMPRKFGFDFIIWMFGLFLACLKALIYVFKYKPSVIFATGGYVCAPILFCAYILNIPYVLHDCDIFPGIVTRTFAKGAKSISLAFEDALKYIKAKNVFVNGNPIRHEFKTISKKQARQELSLKDAFTILIMGGSLGARKINNSSFKILKEYGNREEFEIIWQTGKKNFDEVTNKIMEEFGALPDNLVLQPYFDKMYLALLSSDMVISRAGSVSLSEICASGLPAILIPYPYAAADHQKKNAQSFASNSRALMLEDKDCTEDSLFELTEKLINNKKLLSDLAYNAYKCAKPDAVTKIIEQIKTALT